MSKESVELKYVRHVDIGFIVWPMRLGGTGNLFHSHVGHATRNVPVGSRVQHGGIVSAGFAHISHGKVSCYGISESLQIGSLPEDASLLAKQLGLEAS